MVAIEGPEGLSRIFEVCRGLGIIRPKMDESKTKTRTKIGAHVAAKCGFGIFYRESVCDGQAP